MRTVTTIASIEVLREIIGPPLPVIEAKIVTTLTAAARTLIERSRLVLVATAGANGTCDLALWGGSLDAAAILNDRALILADHRLGDTLVRSFDNLAGNGHVGLNFVIPGRATTVRVNGRASVTRPRRAIMVDVEEVYMHCAKAFLRSRAWDPETWPAQANLPTSGEPIDGPLPYLSSSARRFVARSPLALLATSDATGTCDASVRGDPPGSVLILDDTTLVLGDRPGNRLAQSFANLISNNHVAVRFVVPGDDMTVHITGTAVIVSDASFFAELEVAGKRPKLATVVHIERVDMRRAEAFSRARAWDQDAWQGSAGLPTMGEVIKEQVPSMPSAADVDKALKFETQHLYEDVLDQIGRPPGP